MTNPRKPGGRAGRFARLAILLTAVAAASSANDTLTILHINDLHSRLQPVDRFGASCLPEHDAAGQCLGGVARIKTLIDARRRELTTAGETVVVLDGGDQFQGSFFYTTYRGDAAAEFMNTVGFDAMTLGNHEFDDGPQTLARFAGAVEFPLLAANVLVDGNSPLAGRIAPYTIIDSGEDRVGVIGAVTEDTAEISSPGPQISFQDASVAIARAANELTARGIDRIVALTHLGLSRDREIARTVDGIDAVVGGHSHTLLALSPGSTDSYPIVERGPSGRFVAVVQAGAHGTHVGELRLRFDADGGVIDASGTVHRLDASVAPDPTVAARVAALAAPFQAQMADVVGSIAAPVDASTCRHGECAMGNLVADAVLARTRSQGVEAVLINGGSLRASLGAGDVTRGDVLTVMPFYNTLSTFVIRGDALLAALENGVGRAEEGAGRFPQVAGLRFEWSPGRPVGERIGQVWIQSDSGFAPLDPERDYLLASNDYLRRGGDGYDVLRDAARRVYDFGPALHDVLIDYLATHRDNRPLVDGRIARID